MTRLEPYGPPEWAQPKHFKAYAHLAAIWACEDSANGTVYFIQAADDGPIKIGWTGRHIRHRFSALQSSSPVPLTLRAIVPASFNVEGQLHHTFRADRLYGEWFASSEVLEELIEHAAARYPL